MSSIEKFSVFDTLLDENMKNINLGGDLTIDWSKVDEIIRTKLTKILESEQKLNSNQKEYLEKRLKYHKGILYNKKSKIQDNKQKDKMNMINNLNYEILMIASIGKIILK